MKITRYEATLLKIIIDSYIRSNPDMVTGSPMDLFLSDLKRRIAGERSIFQQGGAYKCTSMLHYTAKSDDSAR